MISNNKCTFGLNDDLIKLERVFISRPRRFGKSLTLDTIATLFETGVEPYFKGQL